MPLIDSFLFTAEITVLFVAHRLHCCRASAGSTHILERFEIFWFDGSMVPLFIHGSISKCLAAAPVFLFRATRHFVLSSCEFKICAEVVVHRMFAVFLNSLSAVQELLYGTFFSVFLCQVSRLVIASIFFTQIVISGIRIVSCDRRVLYVYLTCE